MRPRLGSMFSGVGGLDLALADALDAETVFVADVCKFDKDGKPGHSEPHRSPCSVLAHRFPGVPNLGDVSLIDWAPWRGAVEIVCAGFPCQDVGYPAGWVTDVPGVTWNEALKAYGNSVVPQQGAAAVRHLLTMSGAA